MATYINKNMIDGVEELPRLTEEEFLAIPVAERPKIWVKRNATETDRGITAEDVEYNNSTSELQATDVQAAIDELEENIEEIPADASELPYSSTQSTKQKIDELSTVDELFLYKTCSSANVYEELTLPNNHKFSEYKMIAFYANHYGNVYGSLIEPIALFNTHTGTGNKASMYLDNSSSKSYSFYKTSDTKFMASMWTNETQYRFSMYGIR